MAIGLASLVARGRTRSSRWTLGLLAWVTVAAALWVPHPVESRAPAEPASSSLFQDAAYWHPQAAHQSLAFRGRPAASVDPRRETWLVVGGSVTYGAGVAPEETYTAVAERLLRASGRPVDLLNAGAEGWNLQAIDRWLQDMGDRLAPRGIVLVSILNNATLPIPGLRPAACDASLLAAFACNRWRSAFFLRWPKVLLPKFRNAERHEVLLRELLARETDLGREVILMDEPSEAQIHGGAFRWFGADGYRDATRRVAAEFDLVLHPVHDALAALPRGEAFLDGIHPTPAAHRVWGRRLFEIFVDRERRLAP
ncbi:MAG: SGNH/GDSL hydrolase family protein [Myxococcales bacterium]|nr:SGNH/GDSL hydrolase family protein [Myxococcales bacterium]